MSGRSDQFWGIEGYEVPKHDFDCEGNKREREYFEIRTGKRKAEGGGKIDKDAKKPSIFRDIEKISAAIPPPWKYQVKDDYVTKFAVKRRSEGVSKSLQQMKFRWMDVPKEERQIVQEERLSRGKPDISVSKHTFIDSIIAENKKERYPKPGPSDHYLSQKSIKRFHADSEALFARKMPEGQRKSSVP